MHCEEPERSDPHYGSRTARRVEHQNEKRHNQSSAERRQADSPPPITQPDCEPSRLVRNVSNPDDEELCVPQIGPEQHKRERQATERLEMLRCWPRLAVRASDYDASSVISASPLTIAPAK